MSELTEYLEQHGAESVAAQIRGLPEWRLFNAMWKCPQDILHVVEAMGFETVAEVQAWVTASMNLPKPGGFVDLIVPPLPTLGAPVVLTWLEIDAAIAQQCPLADDYRRINSDRRYIAHTYADTLKIAQACVSHRYRHTGAEVMDCDDFVNIARGWLSANGLGNLAAGKAGTRHYLGDELQGGHAVVLVVTVDPLTCHWWEPQTGTLHPGTYPKLGGFLFANRIELAYADF